MFSVIFAVQAMAKTFAVQTMAKTFAVQTMANAEKRKITWIWGVMRHHQTPTEL